MSGACPTTENLAAALRGRQSSAVEADLAAHLAECPACQTRLEELAGGSSWLETRAKAHAAAKQPVSDSLHQAMQALESRSDSAPLETASPVKLDFLQPWDQPGVLGRFGPYEVLEQVAAGGMGIVLKARDPGLNRIIALKILPPALAANSLARARFIREARAAAAVVHEHVVPIYAVDEFAGLPYLVMQFVQGRTLSERIRASGPLRLEEILRIGAQTAAGLAAAHDQGLIHRDVKPGNILLENSVERVKITDFGLARATDDSSLTREGYIAGTPEYMSPEQARNEPVDQRADLFSFGCVLYEMATGVSPFRAEKPLVAMRRVCDEEPAPAHKLNPKIPKWLGQLIQQLLAKDPASRPQTAAKVGEELGGRLAEFQQTNGPGRPADRPRAGEVRRRLVPAWLAVLILPVLLALVVIVAKRPRSQPKQNETAVTPAGETNTAVGSEAEDAPVFFVSASGVLAGSGFTNLADAVGAARVGGVIECRFNGIQKVQTVRTVDKALVIRAAPGFEPVLAPVIQGEPILFTDAALVIEGLTFLTTPGRSQPNDRRGPLRDMVLLHVEAAPFLAAHCRFDTGHDRNPAELRKPHTVRLMNAPAAQFLQCEFISGPGYAVQWSVSPDSTAPMTNRRLVIQGCTLEGNLISMGHRSPEVMSLELQQNTLCGDDLLLLIGSDPQQPFQLKASRNVFALGTLVHRRSSSQHASLTGVIQWTGESNIYSVESYAQGNPAIRTHEEWLAHDATEEAASVHTELGIQARLANLTDRTRAAEAAAFTLTAEERQHLKTQGWTSPKPPGADPQKTGPGRPYHEWRNSSEYAEWLKLVREHVPQSTANQ